MKQKYIEGTNQQYSIREDGTVISHYKRHNKAGIIYRELIKTPNLNKTTNVLSITINRTPYTVKKLVMAHFYKGQHHTNIIHIDNNPENCSLNNLEYVPILDHTDYIKEWREEHPNKEKLLEIDRKSQKKAIDRISKSYAAHLLRMSIDDMPDDLYEFKKAQLKLKRLIKTKRNGKDQKLPTVNNNIM